LTSALPLSNAAAFRHREECPMSTAAAVKDDQPAAAAAHRFAKDQLKAFVERVERLEEEKKAIADDIRDVYGTSTSARSRRPFSRPICTRSGCSRSLRSLQVG
jgi:hypothetical protein